MRSSTPSRPTTSRTPPAGSDPQEPGEPGERAAQGRSSGITPASRLLFWIRAAFFGDAALAAFGGVLLALGSETAAFAVFAFAAVRALLGVVALLIAARALERRHPNDDAPSTIR